MRALALLAALTLHPVLDCVLDRGSPQSWDLLWDREYRACEIKALLRNEGRDGGGARSACTVKATQAVAELWDERHDGMPRTEFWPCDRYPYPADHEMGL